MSKIATGMMNLGDQTNGGSQAVVWTRDASPEAVKVVLQADPSLDDGLTRSQFVWVRFPNGDLMLGVFPQDATYFLTEGDHSP